MKQFLIVSILFLSAITSCNKPVSKELSSLVLRKNELTNLFLQDTKLDNRVNYSIETLEVINKMLDFSKNSISKKESKTSSQLLTLEKISNEVNDIVKLLPETSNYIKLLKFKKVKKKFEEDLNLVLINLNLKTDSFSNRLIGGILQKEEHDLLKFISVTNKEIQEVSKSLKSIRGLLNYQHINLK